MGTHPIFESDFDCLTEPAPDDMSRRPPPDIAGMTSLKIDNLSYRTDAESLRRTFGKFGEIGDVYIPKDKHGESRGFAFVRFYDKRDAGDAIDDLAGKDLDGREIRVDYARHERPALDRRRGGDRDRRRSRSRSRDRRRRRSRSDSRDRRRRRSPSRDRSRSSRGRDDRRDRKRSRSRSQSRSGSRDRRSKSRDANEKKRSRSRSAEKKRSRSRSRSRSGSR